jgi:hypothetical protein
MDQRALTADDFAQLTGVAGVSAKRILKRYPVADLRYRELAEDERERAEAEVEDVINNRALRTVGGDDPTVWERGWGEVAASVKDRQITIEALRPQYFRGEPVCRLNGRYVRALAPGFEYDAGLILRRIVFDAFLGEFEKVIEIGCGTGINLLLLMEQFPGISLVGCDWAQASCDILSAMARQTGQAIKGHVFNMLTGTGWDGEDIDGRSAVVTVHAMEQLGAHWQPFLQFLQRRAPALCLHIEPLLELYDAESAFDDRARRYHLKRNYLNGFHAHIGELARAGKASILASRRVRFGGFYHEAYSILAWRPAH